MSEPLSDKQIDRLIADYLADSLRDADRPAFERWLRASPEHPRRVARLSMTDFCIREVCQDTKSDYLLDVLKEIEEAAGPAQLVTLQHLNPSPWQRYRLHAICGAIAAALMLGMVLTAVLLTRSQSPAPIANTNTPPTEPGRIEPPLTSTPVATLTATRYAVWAEGALTSSSQLHPGQRLTLTAGFAEITTKRGAIAIIEAPATIELLNNDNALHLHAGKLVGICETDSSKGFLVRTPLMDITDLGTRFGVDASQTDATEVHVFDGEVQAARSNSEPVLLAAEQSAKAVAGDTAIVAIHHDTSRFASIQIDSGMATPLNKTILHTDTDGRQWLIAPSENPGPIAFNGNTVSCAVNNEDFQRDVAQGNAYGFIQYHVVGAGLGKPATAVGSWTLSNLLAGRYDVATTFEPGVGLRAGGSSIRYTVNGVGVEVDQSAVPAPDAGPTFEGRIGGYQPADEIHFTLIGSSVVVAEGGSITVTIDNANHPATRRAIMDSVAITLVKEAGQD